MKTTFETLLALADYCVNLMKQNEMIDFDIASRESLLESLATELAVSFATDEDIRDQAIEEVEEKMGAGNMPEDIVETEIFNHARKEIIKSFSGENIGGLYLVESLHNSAKRINSFMLNSDLIDDVFGTDDEILEFLVKKLRSFKRQQ